MNPSIDAQGGQEEQSHPHYPDLSSSRFNPSDIPPGIRQFVDAHRQNLQHHFVNSANFHPQHNPQPPFHPHPYPPQFPPLPHSSYYPPQARGGYQPRAGIAMSSSGRGVEGRVEGGRSLAPDLLQLRDEHAVPQIIGIPSEQRRANEHRWQQLNDDRFFALVGATAVTHCYSGNTQLDSEKELQKSFNQDVNQLYKRFQPPDFLSKEQKQRLQEILQNLEVTWNASYVNMTKLHESSNRFMSFNINVGPPASPLPSLLQHKFRALAHAALKLLALPIRPDRDITRNNPSRGLMNPSMHSHDTDFWLEVARRFPGDHRTVLKGWLLMNFARPYPNEHDKAIMAKITGMSRVQIGNWFINQRVRWWRPLVEELANELQQEMMMGGWHPHPPHPPQPSMPGQPPPGFDMIPPGGLPPPPPQVLQQLQKQFPPEIFQGRQMPGSSQNMFSMLQPQDSLMEGNLRERGAGGLPSKGEESPPSPLGGSVETPQPQTTSSQSYKATPEINNMEVDVQVSMPSSSDAQNTQFKTFLNQQNQIIDLSGGGDVFKLQKQGQEENQGQGQGQAQGQGQKQGQEFLGDGQMCTSQNQQQLQNQRQNQGGGELVDSYQDQGKAAIEREKEQSTGVGTTHPCLPQKLGIAKVEEQGQYLPHQGTEREQSQPFTPDQSFAPTPSPTPFQQAGQSPTYSVPVTEVRAGDEIQINHPSQVVTDNLEQQENVSEPQFWDPLDKIRTKN